MARPLSPIHSPLKPDDVESVDSVSAAPVSRITRLAALDRRLLSGRVHSLGAGGASALFAQAVSKALVDEMADQLREGPFEVGEGESEMRKWAAEIVTAFEEGE